MDGNRDKQESGNENDEKQSVKAKRKVKAAVFTYRTLLQKVPGAWGCIPLDFVHTVAFSERDLQTECFVSLCIKCVSLLALFELDKCRDLTMKEESSY